MKGQDPRTEGGIGEVLEWEQWRDPEQVASHLRLYCLSRKCRNGTTPRSWVVVVGFFFFN